MKLKLTYVLLAATAIVCIGCDPVRTISQTVVLQIVDAANGALVPDAVVSIKLDFDRFYTLSEEASELARERYQQSRDYWEQSPWFSGTTDANGEVRIAVMHTALDRTMSSEPPEDRDVFKGRPYFVRVRKGQQTETTLRIIMEKGAGGKEAGYSVRVTDIKVPRYAD